MLMNAVFMTPMLMNAVFMTMLMNAVVMTPMLMNAVFKMLFVFQHREPAPETGGFTCLPF